jgi:hypothetical protein
MDRKPVKSAAGSASRVLFACPQCLYPDRSSLDSLTSSGGFPDLVCTGNSAFSGWLVLTCEMFSSIAYRSVAAFIVTFTAPGTETWLNTIGSQFHLAICVGIILVSDLDHQKPLKYFTVALGALKLSSLVDCNGIVCTYHFRFIQISAGRWHIGTAPLCNGFMGAISISLWRCRYREVDG